MTTHASRRKTVKLLGRSKSAFAAIGVLLAGASLGMGQTESPDDRLARLLDNRDQLTVTLRLADLDQVVPAVPDPNPKTVWMSGQPVQIITYITNPTATALEIPDPSDPRAGDPDVCYQIGLLLNGSIDWHCGVEDSAAASVQLDVASRMINPSETIVVVHKTTELIPGAEDVWLGEAGLPRSEGHYSLGYLGGQFEFDIQAPVPLASVLVPLHAQRTYVDTVQGTGATDALNMFVFSVSDNGWPAICWTIGNVEGPINLFTGPQGRLDPLALNTIMPIGYYVLPSANGGTPGPIATLTATADALDRITIDYSGSDGVHHLLQLNAGRRLPAQNEETISTPSIPSGPASGSTSGSYQYTASGATSSLGNAVQYAFDFGDGTYSDWLDAGSAVASQSWATAASYPMTVQARSAVNRAIVSSSSAPLMVMIGGGAPPTIGSITPASGTPGTAVAISISGTNFFPGAAVTTSNGGVAVSNLVRVGFNQITATLTIASNTTPGPVNLTVTTAGGSSQPFPFTVNPLAPTLTGLNPATGIQGSEMIVTLNGTGFLANATVSIANQGMAVRSLTVLSSTQISADFVVGPNAAPGNTSVTVTTSAGSSAAAVFTVIATPRFTSISPTAGAPGAAVPVTLTGANFGSGATVAVSNPGITVSGLTVVSATQISATFAIAANATPGAANVAVSMPGAGASDPVPFTELAPEVISTPAVPVGPASGVSGTLYQYTASGAASSVGHTIQYSFDWGDGSRSGWTPPSVSSSFHTWTAPGTYVVTVQARCTVDTTVVSMASAGLTVTIAGESITPPGTPSGPSTAVTGTTATYSVSGASSSLGHTVQYMIFWGDGSNSPWLAAGTTSASHSWPGPGTFLVTATARCTIDTQVISTASAAFTVTVSAGETISTPTAPTGPATGVAGTSYTYSTGGATSSAGNAVRYLFDWGDGNTSGWLAVGVTSAAHQWSAAGSYTVQAFAASSASLLIQSSGSAGVTVSIQ